MNVLIDRMLPLRALVLLVCAACGTGSSGPSAGGGVGGTGISYGKITGFGSVFVNGIEFDSTNAAITLDGATGSEDDLLIGMVVTVRGEIASTTAGTADSIKFDDNVEGPIDFIEAASNLFSVLDIPVLVEGETLFTDGKDLTTLEAGNVVEVSGFTDSSGTVHATLVRYKTESFIPDSGEIEVKGLISDLGADMFSLGSVKVNYATAEIENVPGGALSEGLYVEVRSAHGFEGDTLIASRIEGIETALSTEEGDELQVEGFVTAVDSATDFEISGQPVRISPQTQFENGAAGDIALNVRLEAEGQLDASGVLIADEVEFHSSGEAGGTGESETEGSEE